MGIAEILNIVFGGTTLCGVIAAIVYRRQNKRIKESEAKQAESTATVSDVEAQKAKIDLGEMFLGKAQEWFTQIEQMQKKGNEANQANQEKMMQRLERIDERTENVELSLADVVKYLNGDYQQWLANHQKPTNRYGKN